MDFSAKLSPSLPPPSTPPVISVMVWPERRGLRSFVSASLFETVGFLLFSAAVSIGQVVLNAPIMATIPMWVLLGSILLLRDLEKVTLRAALGSGAVVGDTILLTPNK